MDITCIGHSGFLLRFGGYNLIFDYFRDSKAVITPEVFEGRKTLVFVSHNHGDHYNKQIFDWRTLGDVSYILDSGCEIPKLPGGADITTVKEGDDLPLPCGFKLNVYGSTDEGVSFLLDTGDTAIFHAGDLNDWYWEEESTPEELARDEKNYLDILKQIAGRKIDIAFVPEDPRLGRNSGKGISFFRDVVKPGRIIPMHFPGNDGKKY